MDCFDVNVHRRPFYLYFHHTDKKLFRPQFTYLCSLLRLASHPGDSKFFIKEELTQTCGLSVYPTDPLESMEKQAKDKISIRAILNRNNRGETSEEKNEAIENHSQEVYWARKHILRIQVQFR